MAAVHQSGGRDDAVQTVYQHKEAQEQQDGLVGPLLWRGFWREAGAVKMLDLPLVPAQENQHVPVGEGHETYKGDVPKYPHYGK